ncbi:TPA: type 1 fimbrial protein, partial [Acinetobacter baumannii]|nr:type 1 fimbrial protein [Acinetobacter baumannii]
MKKFIFIAASSLFNIAAAQAADGTITINGLVTDNTCTIDTGDKNRLCCTNLSLKAYS